MIVKNEAQHLARCLASVQPLAQEIIVVDTGSSDATLEVAARFTQQILHFDWCDDFAAARNFSMAQAKSEWGLILDADEWLPPEMAELLPLFLQDPRFEGPSVLNARIGPPQGRVIFSRAFFRNHQGLRFQGRVHEKLVLPGGQAKLFDCFALRIYEEPPQPQHWHAKQQKYLALIELELQTPALPADRLAELWKHKAEALGAQRNPLARQQALQQAWNHYQGAGFGDEDLFGSFLLRDLLTLSCELQADWARVRQLAEHLLKRSPDWVEGWYCRALASFYQADTAQAGADLQVAFQRLQGLAQAPAWELPLGLLQLRLLLLGQALQRQAGLAKAQALFKRFPSVVTQIHWLRAVVLQGLPEHQLLSRVQPHWPQGLAMGTHALAQWLLQQSGWSVTEQQQLQSVVKSAEKQTF